MKKIFFAAIIIAISAGSHAQTILPSTITFERMVVQVVNSDEGKNSTTYYFTINGDYAFAKHTSAEGDQPASILYTKDGKMCMVDEQNKTITILNMPKVVAEGAEMSKETAEQIKKAPLEKDKKENMTITKTNNTKTIFGYTAYQYLVKNEGGTMNCWYAKVDFNPIKIYTMGAGNKSISGSKAASLKNNLAAIPVINQNYLWIETEIAGKKGMETTNISKTGFTFNTTGYSINDLGKKGLIDILKSKSKKKEN
ncbi:MAG: hypothetical protein JSU03_02100 [Bacteroidetes bacterium]|nr:hypothetical protein [Bacteroidota bacterium]MBS1756050.1 hypothetical protein [Bacteroidota bacterium]